MRRITNRGPGWRGLFEGYSKKFVRQNYWRVAKHFGGEDDALQTCAEIFFTVRRHYAGRYTSPAHLMALYKITLARQWLLYARSDYNLRWVEDIDPDLLNQYDLPVAEMAVAWHEQSKELRQVLTMLSDAPSEVLQVLFQHASVNDMNTRIKAWCGIRSRRNVVRELKRLTAG